MAELSGALPGAPEPVATEGRTVEDERLGETVPDAPNRLDARRRLAQLGPEVVDVRVDRVRGHRDAERPGLVEELVESGRLEGRGRGEVQREAEGDEDEERRAAAPGDEAPADPPHQSGVVGALSRRRRVGLRGGGAGVRPPTALLVDDEPALRAYLRGALARA